MKLTVKLKGGSAFEVDLTKEVVVIDSIVIRIIDETQNSYPTNKELRNHDLALPLCMLEGFTYEEGEK